MERRRLPLLPHKQHTSLAIHFLFSSTIFSTELPRSRVYLVLPEALSLRHESWSSCTSISLAGS